MAHRTSRQNGSLAPGLFVNDSAVQRKYTTNTGRQLGIERIDEPSNGRAPLAWATMQDWRMRLGCTRGQGWVMAPWMPGEAICTWFVSPGLTRGELASQSEVCCVGGNWAAHD